MTSTGAFVALIFIQMLIRCGAGLQPITVNPATQRFVDADGRERFFHGTNVVVKHFPWHPKLEGFAPGTFSEQDMQLLQSLGLNALRLGFMWPGLEPMRGKYNETYLQIMEKIVSLSAKYGIYVLLDMHQDVMSRKFCVEGFPDWAVNPGHATNFPEPLHVPYELDPKTNLPSDEDCAKFAWSTYYVTEAASAAFQNLYNNTDGLRDTWAAFWAKAASTFRDYPSVVGYELINEPWAGDIYADPLLMVPKVADRMNLAPAYDVLAKAIRSHDEQKCIFFEPVTWDDYGVGFDSVPGGERYKNRSVLSYHYYNLPSGPVDINFMVRTNDLKRLQCGGMLTEFQASYGDLDDCLKTMAAADKYLQSWMGWDYHPYYPQHDNVHSSYPQHDNVHPYYPQHDNAPYKDVAPRDKHDMAIPRDEHNNVHYKKVAPRDRGWDYHPIYPSHDNVPYRKVAPRDKHDNGPYKKVAPRDGDASQPIYAQNTSRTYPHAVAGHAISFQFDPKSLEFSLKYETTAECKSTETVIYVNTDAYKVAGGGYQVSINPAGAAKWSSAVKNLIVVDHGTYSGTITVHISTGQNN